MLGKLPAQFHGELIARVGWLESGGPKNRHRRPDLGHRLKRIHKLRHDTENPPRIFLDEVVAKSVRSPIFVAHAREDRGPYEVTQAGEVRMRIKTILPSLVGKVVVDSTAKTWEVCNHSANPFTNL